MDTGLVSSAAPPRIFVTVPGVEDLESVIVLLRAAGAEITDQHREFVIQGPLTPQRASRSGGFPSTGITTARTTNSRCG